MLHGEGWADLQMLNLVVLIESVSTRRYNAVVYRAPIVSPYEIQSLLRYTASLVRSAMSILHQCPDHIGPRAQCSNNFQVPHVDNHFCPAVTFEEDK